MGNPVYFTAFANRQRPIAMGAALLVLFGALAQLASFGLIQNYVISGFGAQPEEVSVALQATYLGILAAMPIQFRLQRYFHIRVYLLVALVAGVLINLGSMVTSDIHLFIVLRFLQGITIAIIAGNMLMVVYSLFPQEKSIVVGSSIFFGFILICGVVIGIAAAWVTIRTDWKAIYYFLIGLQLLSVMICFSIFNARSIDKRYPLYQTDWAGSIIFSGFGFAFLYVFVFGPKSDWLADKTICCVAAIGLFLLMLLLYRQLSVKRPMLDLRVFRYKQFIVGVIILAIFYGSKDSINLIYNYTGVMLGWQPADIVLLGCWNVVGVVTGCVLSAVAIFRSKRNIPLLIIAGLFAMLVYHLTIYKIMMPGLSFNDLIFPVAMQGLACGVLFVPIILMCFSSLPAYTGVTGILICAYVRFIATINGITGYYTLQLSYSQVYKESLFSHFTATDFELANRTSVYRNLLLSKGFYGAQNLTAVNSLVAKTVGMQSQLLAIKAVFFTVAVVLAAAILLLLGFAMVSKLTGKNDRLHSAS